MKIWIVDIKAQTMDNSYKQHIESGKLVLTCFFKCTHNRMKMFFFCSFFATFTPLQTKHLILYDCLKDNFFSEENQGKTHMQKDYVRCVSSSDLRANKYHLMLICFTIFQVTSPHLAHICSTDARACVSLVTFGHVNNSRPKVSVLPVLQDKYL